VQWKPRDYGASPDVSRPYLLKDAKLIDPMTGSEPLYPPVPNQWLIDHHLDYTDMNILDRRSASEGIHGTRGIRGRNGSQRPFPVPPALCQIDLSGVGHQEEFLPS